MPHYQLSFEYFPPRPGTAESRFWNTFDRLADLKPDFVSLTYGAGGTDREHNAAILNKLLRRDQPIPAAHIICVSSARDDLDQLAKSWWDMGVRRLVALRGDMPDMAEPFRPHPEGYQNAADFVAGLRRVADFDISVGAYPESHPDSPSPAADLDNLKRKLDAGAARAITQYFFEAEVFLRFRDRAQKAGISAPLVPGILPIGNFERVVSFSARCGTSIPRWLVERFDGLDQDPEARALVATATAVEMCQRLKGEGVTAFHFYTLNQAPLTQAICRRLALRPSLSNAA